MKPSIQKRLGGFNLRQDSFAAPGRIRVLDMAGRSMGLMTEPEITLWLDLLDLYRAQAQALAALVED